MTRCTAHEPVHSTSSDPSDTAGHLSGVEIFAAHEIKRRGFLDVICLYRDISTSIVITLCSCVCKTATLDDLLFGLID